ncbi:MAG: AraC family transcriptional regulator [Leptolyngbya sp. SIO3F4]|nr:AraC family transcriptional regulator [Leptolyngbya sp. SIO3F4]
MIDTFRFTPPSKELAPYVKYFWMLEGKASGNQPYRHTTIPDGTTQLLFALPDGVGRTVCMGYGPQKTSRTYVLDRDFRIFGVCLYPFTLPHLCSLPGEAFLNSAFPVETLPGFNGTPWERITNAPDNQARCQAFEGLLRARLREQPGKTPPVFQAIATLLQGNAQASTGWKQRSPRQFQRLVKKYTGFTPKQLLRIARLQRALDISISNSLTERALDSGYYDQAHFTNDFKSFLGKTPKQYFTKPHTGFQWRITGKEVAFFQF